jgi:hypothetical protein
VHADVALPAELLASREGWQIESGIPVLVKMILLNLLVVLDGHGCRFLRFISLRRCRTGVVGRRTFVDLEISSRAVAEAAVANFVGEIRLRIASAPSCTCRGKVCPLRQQPVRLWRYDYDKPYLKRYQHLLSSLYVAGY